MGCILVFSACVLCGHTLKQKISMRINELENMISCISIVENETRVFMSDFITAATKTLKVAENSNLKLFNKIIENVQLNTGQPISEIWKQAVQSVFEGSCYTNDDINLFIQFGNVLGNGDSQSQIENLIFFKTELIKQLNETKEVDDKKGVLFEKIGVYTGVIAVVLLI